jgi:hypothetical protein
VIWKAIHRPGSHIRKVELFEFARRALAGHVEQAGHRDVGVVDEAQGGIDAVAGDVIGDVDDVLKYEGVGRASAAPAASLLRFGLAQATPHLARICWKSAASITTESVSSALAESFVARCRRAWSRRINSRTYSSRLA